MKINKYGCSPSQDVCLQHDSPLISFGFCDNAPDIKAYTDELVRSTIDRCIDEVESLKDKEVYDDLTIKRMVEDANEALTSATSALNRLKDK